MGGPELGAARTAPLLAGWWWYWLPAWVSRPAPDLGNALTDGIHLLHWPQLAAVAPPAVMVGAGGLALLHGQPSVTSSLAVIGVLAAVALSSLHLGVWAWAGYTLVESATRGQAMVVLSPVERWMGLPLATLTHAVVLGLLVVGVPLLVLATRLEVRSIGWSRWGGRMGDTVATLGAAAAGTYLWAQATVVLIRPVFTLQGSNPSVEAVAALQGRWPVLVVVAVSAAGLRQAVERRADGPQVLRAVAVATARLRRSAGTMRLPVALRRACSAGIATLLLVSLVANVVQVAITFAVCYALVALRDAIRTSGRLHAVAAVPSLVRLGIGVAVTFAVTRVGLATVSTRFGGWTTDSFLVPWVTVLVCIALITVLTAPARRPPPAPEHRTRAVAAAAG
ncbi:MAG TPA: hypothetical protein VHF25_01820 [Nitriliruptorales bacterium]|nr:hypothetical protein [Nitriliruptorales bacterium]